MTHTAALDTVDTAEQAERVGMADKVGKVETEVLADSLPLSRLNQNDRSSTFPSAIRHAVYDQTCASS
jgi:hypothetical protein